jgi:hypothetical protein
MNENNFKFQSFLFSMRHLEELKSLNLHSPEFAVFGSGPLAIRGIRENTDVDIIVTPPLWKKLVKEHALDDAKRSLKIGNIEIFKDWLPWFDDVVLLIDEADVCEGIRFVKLKRVIEWKALRNTKKDLDDLEKIRMYIEQYGDGMTKVFG